MALVRVDAGWKTPGGQIEGIPSIEQVKAGAPKIFTVQYDTVSPDNVVNAMFANDGTTRIPFLGEVWGLAAPYLFCRRVRVADPQNPFVFRVICEYTGTTSPLLLPPILREGGQEHAEEVHYDATGKPYRNTVGQRLTGISRLFYDKIFTLTRNEPSDMFVGGDWRGVVNAQSLTLGNWTWGPKKVLIKDISSPRQPGPSPLIGATSTVTSITLQGGVYTVNVASGVGFLNGCIIRADDGTNAIQGSIKSGGGGLSTAFVISNVGIVIKGTPTAIPRGTAVSWAGVGTGINYYWPVTYTLAVRTHVVAFNGGDPVDIGWQRLETNHGSIYRETAGGPLRSTAKYLGVPEVLLHQDGTMVQDTEPDSALYWLLFNDFLPVNFSALALST